MVSRREFLRRYLVYTLGGLVVASCAPREETAPVASAPSAVPTRTLPPTLAPTAASTASAVPPTDAVAPTSAPPTATPAPPYLVVARGSDPAALTRATVEALGGMGRFVKKGDDVIVKPNICIASYPPEYAATTNPQVVAALVAMCLEAGASRVRVMDLPFSGTAVEAYKISGVREAVEKAGGQMEVPNMAKYVDTPFPSTAKSIKSWKIYQDVLKADVIINVPIAKTHSVSTLTLGMKNLMGVVLNRSAMHASLDQCIADISTVVKPAFTLLDGIRVLTRGGPEGGNLAWVKQANTLIAGTDIVSVDVYGAQLFFNKKADQVGHLRAAVKMGLGRTDFDQMEIKEIQL